MPIFERHRIERYKEILTNQPAGLVQDGGFSTYSLDDPSVTPNGTGDFLGIIKTVVLLAEVYKETIDTRNMSFNEFNNLTQTQFDDYVRQGMILLNRQTNGQPQRIGWVEIGRSHSSFYYQSCPGGKRPISEHYFDIQEFVFDTKIVTGDGSEIEPTEALNPIGNFDPNITNNLGVLRPRFEPLNLTDYVKFAMTGAIINSDGESVRINDLALTDQTRPTQVSLLMTNRGDYFDNQFATEVSPGKWGTVRRTIPEALIPGTHIISPQFNVSVQSNSYSLDFSKNEGQCLQTTVVTSTGGGAVMTGGETTTPEISGPTPPILPPTLLDTGVPVIIGGGNPPKNILDEATNQNYNIDLRVNRDYETEPCIKLIHDFPEILKNKMSFGTNALNLNFLNNFIMNEYGQGTLSELGFGTSLARLKYSFYEAAFGRGFTPYTNTASSLDTFDVPNGTFRTEINPNTGCMEITYIGTPCVDYVGPTIVTPADIEYERGDEQGFDEAQGFDLIDYGISGISGNAILSAKKWYKSLFVNKLRVSWGGAYRGSGQDLDRGSPLQVFADMINETERDYPFYFHATDQVWYEGKKETKTIRLSNRGASRLIVTDYSPRGNANFINIGLLNALPLVLNPDEFVDVDVDYNPTYEGLQSWKGKDDPFPALLTTNNRKNCLMIDFEVWVRVKGIGYVRLEDIRATPGVGPFRFLAAGGRVGAGAVPEGYSVFDIKKRNKDYSYLCIEPLAKDR